MVCIRRILFFFFFNDTATTEIYTLSLHDALPISGIWPFFDLTGSVESSATPCLCESISYRTGTELQKIPLRSEEHTSELQSRLHLVCRLLLEKKKKGQKQEIQSCM